jgi:hypothetical protein
MNRGVAIRAWNLLTFCGDDNKYFCNMKATHIVREVLSQIFCGLLHGTFASTNYTALNGRMGTHDESERA